MKTWKLPAAVAQRFAANEYVSACDPMILNCDLCIDEVGDGKKYPRLHIDGVMQGGAMDGEKVHANFFGCGAEYLEVECGELSKLTVTHYRYGSEVEGAEACGSHWILPMENPVEAYFWMGSDGRGHATAATMELNKS